MTIIKNNKWLKTTPHKLFHHLDRLTKWMNGENVAPIFVELGPTNICNQNCSWCYTKHVHGKLNFSRDLYLKIIRDLAVFGIRSVCIQGTGEPFCNKTSSEAIKLGAELGMSMSAITNGMLVIKDVAEECVPYLDWMKISALESDAHIYAKHHGCSGNHFKTLIKNIENIVSINNRNKNSEFVLSASMLVDKDNWHTIAEVAHMAKELGIDFLQVRAPSGNQFNSYITEADIHLNEKVNSVIEKAREYGDDDFLVDIRIDSFEEQNKGSFKKRFSKCYGISFETLIAADACVYPCLRFWSNKEYSLGNLKNSSFEEIWNSEQKENVFSKILNDWDLNKCEMVCKQSYINESLCELKNPPLHKNFL